MIWEVAEYWVMSVATRKVIWLNKLLFDLCIYFIVAMPFHCDNNNKHTHTHTFTKAISTSSQKFSKIHHTSTNFLHKSLDHLSSNIIIHHIKLVLGTLNFKKSKGLNFEDFQFLILFLISST